MMSLRQHSWTPSIPYSARDHCLPAGAHHQAARARCQRQSCPVQARLDDVGVRLKMTARALAHESAERLLKAERLLSEDTDRKPGPKHPRSLFSKNLALEWLHIHARTTTTTRISCTSGNCSCAGRLWLRRHPAAMPRETDDVLSTAAVTARDLVDWGGT